MVMPWSRSAWKRVHQEGPFERHAAPLAHRLDGLELAVGQRAGVVDQPADQRRLAVVDMADDDDAQLLAQRPSDAAYGSRPSHVSVGAQPLEGVLGLAVHGAAGALRRLRSPRARR